jgi:hypothetical protein
VATLGGPWRHRRSSWCRRDQADHHLPPSVHHHSHDRAAVLVRDEHRSVRERRHAGRPERVPDPPLHLPLRPTNDTVPRGLSNEQRADGRRDAVHRVEAADRLQLEEGRRAAPHRNHPSDGLLGGEQRVTVPGYALVEWAAGRRRMNGHGSACRTASR